jgi:hypothetical protein
MAQLSTRSDNRGLAWFLISSALTFAAAYSVGRWLGAVGTISGWTGLPQYESEIPRLQVQARFWQTLALILPFVGAIFVWAGRQKPFDRNDIAGLVFECCLSVAASFLGTIAFLLCILALGTLLHNLGGHPPEKPQGSLILGGPSVWLQNRDCA